MEEIGMHFFRVLTLQIMTLFLYVCGFSC